MKKVLILIPTLQGGGAERVASILAGVFHSRSDLDVSVAVYDNSNSAFDIEVKLINISEPAKKQIHDKVFTIIRRIRKFRCIMYDGKFDIVISFMESANLVNIINKLIFRQSYRAIISVHNNIKSFPKYYLYLMKILYRHSDAIVAVSKGVRNDLIGLDKKLKNKTNVIYNPVSSIFFESYQQYDRRISDTKKKIIAVGSLTHQKGFDLLISAVAKMRNTNNITLKIFGEGGNRSELQAAINDNGLNNCVSLEGFCKSIHREYCKADVFILSSRYEGFGNVLVEAMASGCYPISFDIKHGPSEILKGAIGCLVPAGDITALSRAIDGVCAPEVEIDDDMRRKIRQRAYEFHVDKFEKSWLEIL